MGQGGGHPEPDGRATVAPMEQQPTVWVVERVRGLDEGRGDPEYLDAAGTWRSLSPATMFDTEEQAQEALAGAPEDTTGRVTPLSGSADDR